MNAPILLQGETTRGEIKFTLVNESHQRLDPRVAESRIVVNGKELAGSPLLMVMGPSPRTSRFSTLAPGESLHFIRPLGRDFEAPGVDRVVWEGAGFRSPEIVIRVLPGSRDDL